MKYAIFILTLLLTILSGGCKKKPEPIVITPDIEKNHLQRNHIFGTVRNIQTRTYYVADDSLSVADTANLSMVLEDRKADFSTWQRYSADGFLMHFTKFNPQHDTLLRQEYIYNWKAQLVEWREIDSSGTIVAHGKRIYDRNDFISGEQVFQDDSVVMAFSYTTDGIGNIIKSTQSFGDYSTHTETKYNENGLVEKISEFEPNGKLFKTVKIEYDNYGDEVNRCVYKSGNQMVEYTYTQYSQEGKLLKIIYEDKLHRHREVSYYFDFDEQNNWQTEVKTQNDKIISIRKRKIIYY